MKKSKHEYSMVIRVTRPGYVFVAELARSKKTVLTADLTKFPSAMVPRVGSVIKLTGKVKKVTWREL